MANLSDFDINSYNGADLSGDVGLRENNYGGLTTDWTQPTPEMGKSNAPINPINFGYIPSSTDSGSTGGGGPISETRDFGPPPADRKTQLENIAKEGGLNPKQQEEYNALNAPSAESEANRLRGEISSAWDAYINDIPNSMNYYNQQGDAMTGRAENFKTENLATLQDSKAQSLRDMQKTARAALQAGNNYLGQLGAGDSSARDMYSYAVNRQQQQQQGELDRFSMTEERKINSEYQNQIFGIQQWLSEQQNALVTAQREGRLQKGLDLADVSRTLLNNALEAAATARQNAESRKTALMQWAADNSLNAGQLQNNMSALQGQMGFNNTAAPTSTAIYGGTAGTVDEELPKY